MQERGDGECDRAVFKTCWRDSDEFSPDKLDAGLFLWEPCEFFGCDQTGANRHIHLQALVFQRAFQLPGMPGKSYPRWRAWYRGGAALHTSRWNASTRRRPFATGFTRA
jgi:hypothetical protein